MADIQVGHQPYQRAASLYLRMIVFVLERGLDKADEFDVNDESGRIYAVAYEEDQPVSTARFLPENDREARISRVATLKEHRGKGYGAKVIEALEAYARTKGFVKLTIHSELTAKTFYERLGYQALGSVYEEDGEPC
ncbi:GNAT family N-acetyltransferase, partial [Enterococcus faecalis]|nr:GNAT family N-acetyltransferase [Enterococcus faecalis]